MLDFKQKRKIKEILYSKFTIGLLSLIFIFFINSTWNVYKKASFASYNKKIAENKLNELEKRKGNFISEINKLKTKSGVEEEIRSKFGLVKKGEEVVVIVDQNKGSGQDKEKNISITEKWWKNVLDYLSNVI